APEAGDAGVDPQGLAGAEQAGGRLALRGVGQGQADDAEGGLEDGELLAEALALVAGPVGDGDGEGVVAGRLAVAVGRPGRAGAGCGGGGRGGGGWGRGR